MIGDEIKDFCPNQTKIVLNFILHIFKLYQNRVQSHTVYFTSLLTFFKYTL